MDHLESLEIYISVEAEVKSVPLCNLPDSVLRRMGLSLSDTEGTRKPAGSPKGILICPAVLRRKGQKLASHTGNSMITNLSSLIGREFKTASGPFRMSFVSSNHIAYKVLKDTMPEKKDSSHTSHISLLLPDSAPLTYQDAIFIYHGHIYLFTRKPNRSQSHRKTHELLATSQSSIPSTSDVSSKAQKKRRASLEPSDKELQRKRLHVTLPQVSSKQPKGLLTKTYNHSITDQELLNDNSPKKKHTACRETHTENRTSSCHMDARREQAAEEAAGSKPVWFQPQGEQEEVAKNASMIQDLGGEESESTNQPNDMDSKTKIDCGESASIFSTIESQGATCSFKELAREEMIARTKAKLRQNEAALNNLHSS